MSTHVLTARTKVLYKPCLLTKDKLFFQSFSPMDEWERGLKENIGLYSGCCANKNPFRLLWY